MGFAITAEFTLGFYQGRDAAGAPEQAGEHQQAEAAGSGDVLRRGGGAGGHGDSVARVPVR